MFFRHYKQLKECIVQVAQIGARVKKEKREKREYIFCSLFIYFIYSYLVVYSLLDLQPQYIELKVDMCMSPVLVVNFLLDLYPAYIEVAQRLE